MFTRPGRTSSATPCGTTKGPLATSLPGRGHLQRSAIAALSTFCSVLALGGAISPPAWAGLAHARPRLSAAADAGSYVALTPARVLDTRVGTGAPVGAVAGHATVDTTVLGRGGVPVSGVSAVVLNVTVTAPTAAGYLTVHGAGTARPAVSNLNFAAGETIPNLVIAPVGANGKVSFYNGSAGRTQIVADVSGYYLAGRPTAGGTFGSLTPARVLDTRVGTGAPVGAVAGHATVDTAVLGRGGVPVSGVSAVVLNVTVTAPTAAGYLTVHGAGTARPAVSNLNFAAGETIPNLVIAPVGANGKVSFYNGSAGRTQIVADVSGYYLAGRPTASGTFGSLTPTRVLDTRDTGAPIAARGTNTTLVLGRNGVPDPGGVSAVILTVTVTAPSAGGYLTVYGAGSSRPAASNLNFTAGETIANLVIVPVGEDGEVSFYNASQGRTQVIADVSGYVTGTSAMHGTVTSAANGADISGVGVTVFNSDEDPIAATTTSSSGSYAFTGLTADAAFYVCFDAAPASTAGSSAGYLSQCNGHVPWNGDTTEIPGGTPVSTGDGSVTVSIALPIAAMVSGRITATDGGAPLTGVTITVFGPDTGYAPYDYPTIKTAADGTYTIKRLPPSSSGYVVCFNGASATGGPSHVGYLDRCFDNVAWDSWSDPPAATAIPLTPGAARTGVDDALPAAATVSGTATAAANGAPLQSVYIYAYDATGTAVASDVTDSTGRYSLWGLTAAQGPYRICFDAAYATVGGTAGSYHSECYKNAAWGGHGTPLPSATPVSVTAGAQTAGIDQGL